jgi:ABC-type glycerol-3-phosphate transport system substrate-binding protein
MRPLLSLFCLLSLLGAYIPFGRAQAPVQEIIFWHHDSDPDRAALWQALADEFNGQTAGRAVSIQYYPSYVQQHDAILAALVAGGGPDVALVRAYDAALYQLGDSLVDLTPLAARDLDPAAFYPRFWAQDQWEGQQLGLALSRTAEGLYINLTALNDLGYPFPPMDFREWEAIACTYQQQTGNSAFDLPLEAGFWMAFAGSGQAGPLDFTGPEWSNSLDGVQLWLGAGCVGLAPPAESAQNRFASGQTIFYLDSSRARPNIEAAIGQYYAQPFELAMVPIPRLIGPVALWRGPSLSLFRSSPEREAAAWAWMRWLAEPAQVERWLAISGDWPALMALENQVQMEIWGPFLAAAWYTEPTLAGYAFIRQELAFAVQDILAGQDRQSRLGELVQTVNAIQDHFGPEEP